MISFGKKENFREYLVLYVNLTAEKLTVLGGQLDGNYNLNNSYILETGGKATGGRPVLGTYGGLLG